MFDDYNNLYPDRCVWMQSFQASSLLNIMQHIFWYIYLNLIFFYQRENMHSPRLLRHEEYTLEGSTSNSDMVPNSEIKSLSCLVKVSHIS